MDRQNPPSPLIKKRANYGKRSEIATRPNKRSEIAELREIAHRMDSRPKRTTAKTQYEMDIHDLIHKNMDDGGLLFCYYYSCFQKFNKTERTTRKIFVSLSYTIYNDICT